MVHNLRLEIAILGRVPEVGFSSYIERCGLHVDFLDLRVHWHRPDGRARKMEYTRWEECSCHFLRRGSQNIKVQKCVFPVVLLSLMKSCLPCCVVVTHEVRLPCCVVVTDVADIEVPVLVSVPVSRGKCCVSRHENARLTSGISVIPSCSRSIGSCGIAAMFTV